MNLYWVFRHGGLPKEYRGGQDPGGSGAKK